MSSPYAILGLEPSSDPRAAKAAFHAVAKTCHPDVNADPQARQRFEEAREAYRVITLGAASADIGRVGSPRAGRMTEIDLEVSVWIAARGGSVKGSCPLGKASVRVPAGARSGDRIIARIGKSDVACVIRIADTDGYEIDGGDLVTTLTLSAAQAKAGGGVDLETPLGRLRLQVPKSSQDGDRLLVSGRGLPAANGRPAGDLYLDVEILETMTDRAVAALDRILAKARRPRASHDLLDHDQVA